MSSGTALSWSRRLPRVICAGRISWTRGLGMLRDISRGHGSQGIPLTITVCFSLLIVF